MVATTTRRARKRSGRGRGARKRYPIHLYEEEKTAFCELAATCGLDANDFFRLVWTSGGAELARKLASQRALPAN